MLIADLDYSFFGWNKYFAIYGPYTYTEDWHEYPDYSSDPPVNKGDFMPLIDNEDSSKYYPVTVNGQTYKIYNSAILNNSTGLYICLVCDRPWNTYQLNHDGSQSGEAWVQFQSINAIAQNGVYTCGYDDENPAFLWHSDGFLYNQGSYYDKEITDFHNIETELPIFTNNDDYMNYITNPVEKATCRVNYYLPDSDYTYTKITYKMNDKPQSVNDGTIVNIDPSQSSVDISNLTVHGNYWFTIFTNKSESEAFPYTVEEILSSWQNVSLPCVTGTCSNDDLWTTYYGDWVSNLPDGISLEYLPPEAFNIPKGSTAWLFGDSSWGIMISCGSASDIQMIRWSNGSIVMRTEWFADKSWITSGVYKISILAGKNNTENKGSIPWIINYNNGQSYYIDSLISNYSEAYDWLNQAT